MSKQLVVITHGNFGKAIVESAEMIIGKLTNVSAYALDPGVDPIEFIGELRENLADHGEETIYLVDLYGGSPFHAAAYLVKSQGGTLVVGLNLPLLIEIYTNLENESMNLSEIVDTSQKSIRIVDGL